jgi:hypothetical protein
MSVVLQGRLAQQRLFQDALGCLSNIGHPQHLLVVCFGGDYNHKEKSSTLYPPTADDRYFAGQ